MGSGVHQLSPFAMFVCTALNISQKRDIDKCHLITHNAIIPTALLSIDPLRTAFLSLVRLQLGFRGDVFRDTYMNEKELYEECHKRFSYDAESGLLTRKVSSRGRNAKAGNVVGCVNSRGYLLVWVMSKSFRVHRIIWLMSTGEMPKDQIDHINGNPLDNRLVNLREATHAENQKNRGKQHNNKIGYKGVSSKGSSKNPYLAKITLNGKQIYIGYFPTPELAHQAYCVKTKELNGEFGRAA